MEALPKRRFRCLDCGNEFEEPFGKPRWMVKCPKCGSENIVRADVPARCGYGRGYGRGRGWKAGFGGGGWGRRWRW